MELKFIGQGYNLEKNTSVAQNLLYCFEDDSFHTFKCLVAFASYSGISGLTKVINESKIRNENSRIVVGIDQKGTSKEALEELLNWNVDSFIFNTKSSIIFHPKIYIFQGERKSKIIIGSNNLTQTGLGQNIEGAIEISYSNGEEQGDKILDEILQYYEPIFNGNHNNLEKISIELIEKLYKDGKVPTEAERAILYSEQEVPDKISLPESTEKMLFPSIKIQALPSGFTPKKKTNTDASKNIVELPNIMSIANSGWNLASTSEVLIAEIGGGGRWTQISFAKENFTNFFELPTSTGTKGQKNLRYIEDDGNIDPNVERISSAKVKKSVNFNLEPKRVRETKTSYNSVNKPIIVFIKSNSQNFLYHFETIGSELYNELNRILPGANAPKRLRRTVITLENFMTNCPSFRIN